MQRSLTRKILQNGFWVSLLLHLLVLLALLFAFKMRPEDQSKAPNMQQVPSYIYKGAITPSFQKRTSVAQQNSKRTQTKKAKPSPSQQSTYQPPERVIKAEKSIPIPKTDNPQPSLMASSLDMLRATQMQEIAQASSKAEEPIMLIGDSHEVADPFIQLIGRSLSAFFSYPELEGRMGIKGRVLVQMTLHPEGFFDEVQIVQSSNNQNLDSAALFAVNKAPLVVGADMFIKKPKRFIVGFVFL